MRKATFLVVALIGVLTTTTAVTGQVRLINEVQTDNPLGAEDICEYVELRGNPSTLLPPNTYFVALDGTESGFQQGTVIFVANVSGVAFDATTGLITILNRNSSCPGRTYGTSTIVPQQGQAQFFLFNATSSYFLLTLPVGAPAPVAFVTDYDADDNGTLDSLPPGTTIHDSFAFIERNTAFEFAYAPLVNPPGGGQPFNPDAFVRFLGNNTPNSAGAFYFGQLDPAGPQQTVLFAPGAADRSTNFPPGGRLTPGQPNVP